MTRLALLTLIGIGISASVGQTREIMVRATLGAPADAQISLAKIAEPTRLIVKAGEDPIAAARKLCSSVSETYLDLLKNENPSTTLGPSSVNRDISFPACFIMKPQSEVRKPPGEGLSDFALRVIGLNGPKTLARLRQLNSQSAISAEGAPKNVVVPFSSTAVVYKLKPEAADAPEAAVSTLLSAFPNKAEASASSVATVDPTDLRPMAGVDKTKEKPVTCPQSIKIDDSKWPFDVEAVKAALARNVEFRKNSHMTPARTVAIVVADNGVDGLRQPPFADKSLFLNQGEIPENNKDDDWNRYIDDYAGAGLYQMMTAAAIPALIDHPSHGTMMASLALGGPAWRARTAPIDDNLRILPVNLVSKRVERGIVQFSYPGSGLADALLYAQARKADVINFSVGTDVVSAPFETALSHTDVAVVAAAGNVARDYETRSTFPASYGGAGQRIPARVITVGAHDQNGCLAAFSGRGKQTVDIVAPGVGIQATGFMGASEIDEGTSQAAALVSFTVGLIKAEGISNFTAVRDRLYATATRHPWLADYVRFGSSLNIADAISVHDDILHQIGSAQPAYGRIDSPLTIDKLCADEDPMSELRLLRVAYAGDGKLSVMARQIEGNISERTCAPPTGIIGISYTFENGQSSVVPWTDIALLIPS